MTGKISEKDYAKIIRTNYLIAGIGSFLIIAFFAAYIASGYASNLESERAKMKTLTATAAGTVLNLVDKQIVTLALLDEWIQHNPDADPTNDREFVDYVRKFKESSGFAMDIKLVSKDGFLYTMPPEARTQLYSVRNRDYFLDQRGNPACTVVFSKSVRSRETGKWTVPITFRTRDNRRGIILIIATFEFGIFDELFAEILTMPERSVCILREDRVVLQRSPFDAYLVGSTLDFRPGDKERDIIEIRNPRPAKRAIYYHKVGKYPLYVMIGDSLTRYRNEWLKKAILQGCIGIVILAGYLLLNLRLITLLGNNNAIQSRLEIAARYDAMTGLRNRAYFFERLGEEMERAKRTGDGVVLLELDIDRFKYVNDTFGHPQGDAVIREIAAVIEGNVRSVDITGRVGGEEFAVLMSGTTIEESMMVAERIRTAAKGISLDGWPGGLSIGAARWKGEIETIAQLFKRADAVLYGAKNAGRDRVIVDAEG